MMDREVSKPHRNVNKFTYIAVAIVSMYVGWSASMSPAAKYTTVPFHAQPVKVSGIKPL